MAVEELDLNAFERALERTDKLVIVEFYSTDCAFCRAVAPVYEELSSELGAAALFTKLNAREHVQLAARYGVMGTPTFKFFCKGRPIGEVVGESNITLLRNTIKDFIKYRAQCASRSTPLRFELDGYG